MDADDPHFSSFFERLFFITGENRCLKQTKRDFPKMADQPGDGNGGENTENLPQKEPTTPETPSSEAGQAAAPVRKKVDKGDYSKLPLKHCIRATFLPWSRIQQLELDSYTRARLAVHNLHLGSRIVARCTRCPFSLPRSIARPSGVLSQCTSDYSNRYFATQ